HRHHRPAAGRLARARAGVARRAAGPAAPPVARGGRPVRIGLVCPYQWDVPGGAQYHVRDLPEPLRGLGPHVRGLTPAAREGWRGGGGPAAPPLRARIEARIAVADAPRRLQVEPLGGDAAISPNGVHVAAFADGPSLPGRTRGVDGPTIGFLGRYDEPRKGL